MNCCKRWLLRYVVAFLAFRQPLYKTGQEMFHAGNMAGRRVWGLHAKEAANGLRLTRGAARGAERLRERRVRMQGTRWHRAPED